MDIGTATLAAAIIAAILSLFSLYFSYQSNKKTTFINTITTERIRWMADLRDNISRLAGLTYHWSITASITPEENRQILKEIDRLRMLILLQLNPDEPDQKAIIDLLESIPNNTDPSRLSILMSTISTVIGCTQRLLKETWEEVKIEAREGELREEGINNPWLPEHLRVTKTQNNNSTKAE